jgi:methylenetetrahydrofolate dehydrogenase (NADP+)/methenyltetrahydrofolate cyclohydrolase
MGDAFIIDGCHYAGEIERKLKDFLNSHKIETLRLDVILVGDHKPSEIYVRRKSEACHRVGIQVETHKLPETIQEQQLLEHIERLNKASETNGILVQLPLPAHISKQKVQMAIEPLKDVDGFHVENIGKHVSEMKDGLFPCTPQGCLYLINQIYPDISGMDALVIGRSLVVGMPMSHTLLQADATVTTAHIKTKNLSDLCKRADIIVSAAGHPNLVRGKDVKEGVVVIDVGINRVEAPDNMKAKITGDVNFEEVSQKAKAISPVPGGVGPMTIAFLLVNCLKAYCLQHGDVDFDDFKF